MKRWRSVLSVLIALWLPLQGYAAVAMPFCEHSMAAASALHGKADCAQHPHHSHEHHDGHAHVTGGDAQGIPFQSADARSVQTAGVGGAIGLACNDCGPCHLASAPAIVAIMSVFLPIADSVLDSALADSPQRFYPEQPQRPPLRTLL